MIWTIPLVIIGLFGLGIFVGALEESKSPRRRWARTMEKTGNPCARHKCPVPKGKQLLWKDLPSGTTLRYRHKPWKGEIFVVHIVTRTDGMLEIWLQELLKPVRTYPYMTVHPCKPFDSYNYEVFE